MASRPRIHEDQRLFAAHLADNDTVRRETQRLSKKVFHIYGVRRRQCDLVLCRTLEFLRVLDGDDTFIELRNLSKNGIQKRRLAGSRAACRNDILLGMDGFHDDFALLLSHRALLDVVLQCKNDLGMLADIEARRLYNIRQFRLKTAVGKKA